MKLSHCGQSAPRQAAEPTGPESTATALGALHPKTELGPPGATPDDSPSVKTDAYFSSRDEKQGRLCAPFMSTVNTASVSPPQAPARGRRDCKAQAAAEGPTPACPPTWLVAQDLLLLLLGWAHSCPLSPRLGRGQQSVRRRPPSPSLCPLPCLCRVPGWTPRLRAQGSACGLPNGELSECPLNAVSRWWC